MYVSGLYHLGLSPLAELTAQHLILSLCNFTVLVYPVDAMPLRELVTSLS